MPTKGSLGCMHVITRYQVKQHMSSIQSSQVSRYYHHDEVLHHRSEELEDLSRDYNPLFKLIVQLFLFCSFFFYRVENLWE